MMKAFNSLIWPLWGSEFAASHGFTTDRQQQLIRDVWDMHKCAEAHEIMMEGLWREVIRQFLITQEKEKTYEEFQKWWEGKWMVPILNAGTFIMAFRKGVRENSFDLVHAARLCFLPMWWTTNHPVYRVAIAAFLRDFFLLPQRLQDQVKSWMLGTDSGNAKKHQGLDFVGEGKNRLVLRGVCPTPTFKAWFQAVRLETVFNHLREQMEGDTNLSCCRSPTTHVADLLSWREALRGFLSVETPSNLKGKLVRKKNIFVVARQNMLQFVAQEMKFFGPIGQQSKQHNDYFPKQKKNEEERFDDPADMTDLTMEM